MTDLEQRVAELERRLGAIEPHVRRSMPLGPTKDHLEEIERNNQKRLEEIVKGIAKGAAPVDRSKQQLISGASVPEDRSHTELKPNGQQKDYVVLSPEERAKEFVRPVRRTYIHVGIDPKMDGCVLLRPGKGGCGIRTTMGLAIAETYARDPKFYNGTFCCECGTHRPLDEFVWEGTSEQVGS